jgi:hypothetical protein
VYRLTDGLLRDLGFGATNLPDAEECYVRAVAVGVVDPAGRGGRA